ncbi:hypothetical protein [Actinopolymorpha sp. B9G3]|uniref:hypothetical protein n=1 Tax=Actinopolymorpha sp. B9G3 TaxID=3158970 RepID=UPI0032D8E236
MTEERLRDALGAAGHTIPDDAIPPALSDGGWAPARRSRRLAARRFRTSSWRWPTVAVATAAVLTLVVGLPALILSARTGTEGAWTTAPGTIPAADPPRFYVSIEDSDKLARVVVRDSRTGALVDTATGRGIFWSVAAAPDQRTFYVSKLERNSAGCLAQGKIVRIVLRSDGETASVDTVAGTVDPWAGYEDVAVSPDGQRLASVMRSWKDDAGCTSRSGWAAYERYRSELRVIDIPSGERRAWASDDAELSSPSWAPDSRRLVFLWGSSRSPGRSQVSNSGEIRVLDTNRKDAIDDAEKVTDEESVNLPRLGEGLLRNAAATSDGQHVLAVFVRTVDVETDDAAMREVAAMALVKVAVADGAIEVLDDQLEAKHVGRFTLDASRRHVLVSPEESYAEETRHWSVGRYDKGTVRWLDGGEPSQVYAW